jgi:5-dehydro-2-deoxygluconokinase
MRNQSRVSDVELVSIGRVNLDLYAQQHGVEFAEVEGWDAQVGGSPANVAVAASRLGVRAGMLTAVGEDLVGDWVVRALEREGVDTELVIRKHGPHTSLALRAQIAPDHPLAFYRHDPADIHLTVADASRQPVERTRALLVSADALARGTMIEACASVLRRARTSETTVYLDLDLRHVNWPDLDAYAASVGPAMDDADVILGTEAEFAAVLGLGLQDDPEAVADAVRARLARSSGRVVVLKQGSRGAAVLAGGQTIHVPAYPVSEASTVGAGDSFAAGLICSRLQDRDWPDAGHFASACAAITVSRFGCSAGFPRLDEVTRFMDQQALVVTNGR